MPDSTTVLCFAGVCFLSACESRPHPLEVRDECKSPEVVRCLQQYAYEELSSNDVKRLIEDGIDQCLSKDPSILGKQAKCLPLWVGNDEEGRKLALVFQCADVCPDRGHVVLVYPAAVSREECCARGGLTFLNWTFGEAYQACAPPEYFDVLPHKTTARLSLCK